MNSEKIRQKAGSDWLINFSYLFLFMLLPVFTVWSLGNAIIRQNDDLVRTRSQQQLEENAERICSFIDPVNFLKAHFTRFVAAIDWNNVDESRVRELYQTFSGKKLQFIPYVFKNGQLVTPADLLENTGERIRRFWLFMHGHSTRSNLEHKIEAQAWFGVGYNRFKHQIDLGLPVEFPGRKGRGYLFYAGSQTSNKLDGLFLICWAIPEAEHFTGFIPPSLVDQLEISVETRDLERRLQSGNTVSRVVLQHDSEYLSLRKILGNRYLHFKQRFPGLNHGFYRTILNVLLMVLIVVFATMLRDSYVFEQMRSLSVRFKLVFLVFYAVALPLSGLGYFGWKFMTERRELLIQEAFIACHGSINELESDFAREKFNVLNFFRSLKNMPEMASDTGLLFKKFAALEAKRLMNWIEIRDLDTNILVTTQNPETAAKTGVVAKVFSRHGINSFLAHRLPVKQNIVPSAGEIVLQEFLESPYGGWARIFESPDELHEVSFGGYKLLWYWDVFPQPDYKPAFFLCDQHIGWAVKDFLQKNLHRRTTHEQGAIRRMAWTVNDGELIAADEGSADGELMDFIGRVRRNSSAQNAQISWRGEQWIIAGAPGKRLIGNVILSLFPVSMIDGQINLIAGDLGRGMVIAILLALLIGRLFSYTVISPLSQIMQGVQALRRRDTSHRIEITQNDELGRLSRNFNRTIETLEDVLFAKTIQAQIILDQAPEIKGYDVDIFNLPAADLGGNYGDILPVSQNQWLFIIGDVAGRGVSSSLVTAMAKAIVVQSLANLPFSLSNLLVCLNELLYSQFKQSKCMSLFAATLDLGNGKLCFSNAGHPAPLHFSNGKLLKLPENSGSPLGFSAESPECAEAEITLSEGDCLIFYTAAFPAIKDKNGQSSGTTGFAALCQEFLDLPAAVMRAEIVARILAKADSEVKDDLTMIIIKRSVDTGSIIEIV